jgi:hypothetical protein
MTGIADDKFNLIGKTFLPTSLAPQLNHCGRCVHAEHVPDFPPSHEETHAGSGATTEVDPQGPLLKARSIRQLLRRALSSNVHLLPHQQFPQLKLGTAIDSLYVSQLDRTTSLHGTFAPHQ